MTSFPWYEQTNTCAPVIVIKPLSYRVLNINLFESAHDSFSLFPNCTYQNERNSTKFHLMIAVIGCYCRLPRSHKFNAPQPKIKNPPHTETHNVKAIWVVKTQPQWYQICNIHFLFISCASYTSTSQFCVCHVVITDCRELVFYYVDYILLFASVIYKSKER